MTGFPADKGDHGKHGKVVNRGREGVGSLLGRRHCHGDDVVQSIMDADELSTPRTH